MQPGNAGKGKWRWPRWPRGPWAARSRGKLLGRAGTLPRPSAPWGTRAPHHPDRPGFLQRSLSAPLPGLPQARADLSSPGQFGTGRPRSRHVAALVAPLPRVHPASPRLKMGQFPRRHSTTFPNRQDRASLGEEVGNRQAAAARHVTWLPAGQQPGGSSFVLFICCLFSKSKILHGPDDSLLNLGEMTGWHLGTPELHLRNFLGVLERHCHRDGERLGANGAATFSSSWPLAVTSLNPNLWLSEACGVLGSPGVARRGRLWADSTFPPHDRRRCAHRNSWGRGPGTPQAGSRLKLAESTLHYRSWTLKKPWRNFALAIPL